MALRAVLFDAVGTLIEAREPIGATYARFAARYGMRVDPEAADAAFRAALGDAGPMVFPGAPAAQIPALERAWWRAVVCDAFSRAGAARQGHGEGDLEGCFDALFRHFAGRDAWQPLPGAVDALAALRARGLATGVVSNFDGRLPGVLEGLGLAPLLDCVLLPGEARAAKPDGRIFASALARLGCEPHEAAFVGDDPETDRAAAQRAGLRAVAWKGPATLALLSERLAELFDSAEGAGCGGERAGPARRADRGGRASRGARDPEVRSPNGTQENSG